MKETSGLFKLHHFSFYWFLKILDPEGGKGDEKVTLP